MTISTFGNLFARTSMVAVSASCMISSASAQEVQFNIPSQPLTSALNEFSKQSGYRLLYPTDDLRKIKSVTLRGRQTVEKALQAMIQGSPLEIASMRDRIIALHSSNHRQARTQRAGAFQHPVQLTSLGTPPAGALSVPAPAEDPAEITVTGSRIARKDNSNNSPTVTISRNVLDQTGAVTLDSMLVRMPQIAPDSGSTSNNGTTGGITTISLRSLGANRSLILLDGHRLSASNAAGAADINLVPQSLIESVEVITGGASAAYGSDAVAGVVNFRLNRKFTGLRLDGQMGISSRGDGRTSRLALTAGHNFDGGRGNISGALEYSHRESISGLDREISRVGRLSSTLSSGTFQAAGTNLPSQAAIDSIFEKYGVAAGAVRPNGALSFNNDGSLFSLTGAHNYRDDLQNVLQSGNNVFYNSTGVNAVQIPFERIGAFVQANYELTDDITAYGEAAYQNVKSATRFAPAFFSISVPVTSPFIPADLQTVLASRADPTANASINFRFANVGYRDAHSETDTYRFLGGFKGAIEAIDGTWDIYASRDRFKLNQQDSNGVSVSAVSQLVNAADGGASLCAGGLNLFGSIQSVSCSDYIRRSTQRDTITTQTQMEATVQGKLLTLPAGDLRFALGADYRKSTYRFTPDAALQSGDISSFLTGRVPPVAGQVKLWEVYGELLIPILRDLPLVKELNVSTGYRYSNYDTFGGVESYRVEGDWKPFDDLRFRGSYARAVRAPNPSDLYSPTTILSPIVGTPGAAGQGDPCDVRSAYRTGADAAAVRDLCIAQGMPVQIVDSYTLQSTQVVNGGYGGGNVNLKPETADTYTIGAVVTPRIGASWVRNLSLTVDYYSISIKKAIGTISAPQVIQNCYNLTGLNSTYSASNIYCSLFDRNAETGEIQNLQATNLNLGSMKVSGIDVALDASFPLGDRGGAVDLSGSVAGIDSFKQANFPGATPVEYVGTIGAAAYPKFKGVLNLSYKIDRFRVGGQYRYIDKMSDVSAIGVSNSSAKGVPAYHYFDVFTGIEVGNNFEARLGVNNLFDKSAPAYTSFTESNTMPGLYDVLGRSLYLGLSVKY